MADYVHMPIAEMNSIWAGGFTRAGASLGVEAFGLGLAKLPPDFNHVPKHVHTFDNQEEIYFLLGGEGWLEINNERVELAPDLVIRVGPTASRRGLAGPAGLSQLIVGAMPGEPYKRHEVWEADDAEPTIPSLPGVQAAHDHESSDDYTAVRLEDMEPYKGDHNGITMYPVRKAVGATSVGVNIIDIQPSETEELGSGHPRHDHSSSGQEEVYVPISGSGEIEIEGERIPIAPGEMVRVGPETQRKLIPSPEGLRVIAIGGVPGAAYEPRS